MVVLSVQHPQYVPYSQRMMAKWLVASFLFLVLVIATKKVQGQRGLAGNNYVERQLLCALDKAPCDILGKQVKDALPEIIGNNCKSCDQKQVSNARRIARFVQTKYPDVWNMLVKKYSKN